MRRIDWLPRPYVPAVCRSLEFDGSFSYRQILSVLGFLQIVRLRNVERDGNGTNGFVISSLLTSVVIVLCHILSPFAVGPLVRAGMYRQELRQFLQQKSSHPLLLNYRWSFFIYVLRHQNLPDANHPQVQ